MCHHWSSVCLLTTLPRVQCGLTVSGSTVGKPRTIQRPKAGRVMPGHPGSLFSSQVALLIHLIPSPVTGQSRLDSSSFREKGQCILCLQF